MNSLVQTLNLLGPQAFQFAWSMFWQSSLLIALLFLLDLAMRKRARAAVRYALWLVLLVKLVLPPSLALPTSAAWWIRPNTTHLDTTHKRQSYVVSYGPTSVAVPAREMSEALVILAAPKPRLSPAGWALASAVSFSSVLLVWMLLRWCQVLRRARRATPAPLFLNQMAAATILQTKLPSHVRIKFTARPFSPAVCGLFRPIILFPIALANRLSPAQLRAVLLHEVFHLKRGDVWVNLAQTLLQIAYWWHPLLWLANARIRRLREEAVDDCVMLALRDEADSYAPTLIEVAKMTLQRPLASLGFVGIVESRRSLRHRIERLLNFRKPKRAGLTLQSLAGIFAFSALSLPMSQAPERQPVSHLQAVANPWPDPRVSGRIEVNLEARFFSAESSAVQAVFPSFIPNNRLLVIGSNDLAAIQADLQRANVRPVMEGEPLRFQKFSGGRYHYRVGGVTNNVVNYETSQSREYGETIGARIELVSMLAEWTPMELTLLPLIEDESIRCQMELTSTQDPTVLERAETSIPPGGAILWAASEELAPGQCQLVLLTRKATETRAGRGTGTGPLPGTQSVASDLAPLRDWLERHRANRGTVARTNLPWPARGADSPVAVQGHADPIRGPNGLGDRQLILQKLKNAGYNVDEVVRHATGRHVILSKLESIRLDKGWNGLPLSEVLRDLRTESKQRDPEKRGIQFSFNINVYPGTWVDHTTGLPVTAAAPSESVDIGATRIRINPPLTDVRLIDLLDAIVKVADQRIKYSIEDYAVVFSMDSAENQAEPLFVRTFKVDLNTCYEALERYVRQRESEWLANPGADNLRGLLGPGEGSTGVANKNVFALLQFFFASSGVNLAPPKSMFYGDLEGSLLVRATRKELDIIEQALQTLNAAPLQINLKVKFVEIDDATTGHLLDGLAAQGGFKI